MAPVVIDGARKNIKALQSHAELQKLGLQTMILYIYILYIYFFRLFLVILLLSACLSIDL